MNQTVLAVAAAAFAVSTAGTLSAQAAPAHNAGASTGASTSSCARTVGTMTNLVLDRHTMRAGTDNLITVHVRSMAGPAHPSGSVEISVNQTQSGFGVTKTLNNGVVTTRILRTADAGTYDVHAMYMPSACSKWKRSMSSVQHLTVT